MPVSRASAVGLLFSVFLWGPAFGQGTVRYVSTTGTDTGNDCADAAEPCATLGHTIGQSNGGDTIELSAGTFTEPPMAIDRDLTIRGQGTGTTILQARESNPKAMVGLLGTPSGVTSRLEGLTIRHFEDLIRNEGDLSIADSEILDNTLSGCGCAVTNADTGTLLLERVRVSRNQGLGCGCGAVENWGYIEIVESEISENGCDWEGPNGGGIRNLGEAVVRNTSIVRNDCQDGFGGGIDNRGTMTLEGSTVGENSTLHYSYGGILNTGDLSILNSTVSGNIARDGWIGAIGNTGTLSIVSSTIVSNRADYTTGGISGEGSVSLKNSILADNIDSTGVTDCAGSISSYGYNLISNSAGCTITEVENSGTDIIDAGPRLGPLADNGGKTSTHALFTTSLAVDAGSCTDISGTHIEIDQRGQPRDDGLCDIGSFELQPSDCRLAWSMDIAATDNGAESEILAIGQGASASSGVDTLCGESELPPTPPSGSFDARLVYPDGSTGALSDYRPDAELQVTWRMTFQPGSAGYPFTFTWDPSSLPDGEFTLKDEVTGTVVNVDMKQENTYTLTNTGISSLVIDRSGGEQLEVYVDQGWNLISVPLLAADMSVETLFPDAASSAFSFDSGYHPTDPLRNAEGFWLKFAQSGTYRITGQAADPEDIPISAGWNLIGTWHNGVSTAQITSTPEGIVSSDYFAFGTGYASVETLEPGRGYWVKAAEAGTLHLGGSGKAAAGDLADAETAEWSRLTFQDAEGRSATLLLGHESKAQVRFKYDLPPLPPSGVFDVRFAGDTYAATVTPEAIVELRSAAYPLTIRAQDFGALTVRVRDAIDGSLFDQTLMDGSLLELSRPMDRLVITADAELPAKYALLQNYPNPFNPASTIGYELPEAADVRVVLYDLLGREVRVLLDARREAGQHQLLLEANSLASGMYLYRLEANGFSDTKRLTVLK